MNLGKRLILSAASLALLVQPAIGGAEVTGYSNPNDPALTLVPSNLIWSNQARQAATELKNHLHHQLKSELLNQRAKGATRIVKVYSNISPSFKNRDWKTYTKDIRQYKIKGYDSQNRLVRTSRSFPVQSNMLAASLVYLKQDRCSLVEFSLFNLSTWWNGTCSIAIESENRMLRAALWSWLHIVDNPLSLSQRTENSIKDCFDLGAPFSISGTKFTCPALKLKYGLDETVDLVHYEALGGFRFTVNQKAKTFKVLYLAPDFQYLADLGSWDKDYYWISFSGINE